MRISRDYPIEENPELNDPECGPQSDASTREGLGVGENPNTSLHVQRRFFEPLVCAYLCAGRGTSAFSRIQSLYPAEGHRPSPESIPFIDITNYSVERL